MTPPVTAVAQPTTPTITSQPLSASTGGSNNSQHLTKEKRIGDLPLGHLRGSGSGPFTTQGLSKLTAQTGRSQLLYLMTTTPSMPNRTTTTLPGQTSAAQLEVVNGQNLGADQYSPKENDQPIAAGSSTTPVVQAESDQPVFMWIFFSIIVLAGLCIFGKKCMQRAQRHGNNQYSSTGGSGS